MILDFRMSDADKRSMKKIVLAHFHNLNYSTSQLLL